MKVRVGHACALAAAVVFCLASLSPSAQAMGKHHSPPPAPLPAEPGWGPIPPGIDVSDLPVAHSSADIDARWETLKQRVIDYNATFPIGKFDTNGVGFPLAVHSKLLKGLDIDYINKVLEYSQTNPYAKPGTDIHDIPFCQRTGDYDFMLRGLIPIAFEFRGKPWLLSPAAYKRLVDVLLDQKGDDPRTEFSLGICGSHAETENHILMTEGSRYLTNQLYLEELKAAGRYDRHYDNARNGMNGWMLRHLQTFFKKDFYEFNSHPYQSYTVMAIENLYNYAWDEKVKTAAGMLLDYLDAKFAVSSNNQRRYTPFRRQPQYVSRTDLPAFDGEIMRMHMACGANELYGELPTPNLITVGSDEMFYASISRHRVADLTADLILNHRGTYFQHLHHDAVELYAGSPSFLLSAGGVHVSVWDYFSNQMDEWAVATTLIPSHGGGFDAKDMIRFAGATSDRKRVNTCVAPNFMCGLNPVVPASIPASCQERSGSFTFFDFTSPNCPLKWNFYAALYSVPCDCKHCSARAGSFGYLEAEEASLMSYSEFRNRVLSANGGRSFHSEATNTYVTASGHSIGFIPLSLGEDGFEWSIRTYDGRALPTNLEHYPMANGDIINADGSGLVTVTNPALRKRLTLDMRNPASPRRIEQSY